LKPRTLLVLLVVVLGVSAFIQFYERKLPSSEERAKLGNRVLGVEKDDIQAIEIVRNGQTVRLERVPAAKKKERRPASPSRSPAWRAPEPWSIRT
jgi:hypothetical protein